MGEFMRFSFAISLIVMATLSAAAQQRQPDGNGDPKATSCMTGEKPTGSQVPIKICYTNAQWVQLKATYIVIGPDGRLMLSSDAPPGYQIVGPDGKPLLPANDPRNIHMQRCERQYTGGPNSTMSPSFNEVCSNSLN
jgi:hypothetical protein